MNTEHYRELKARCPDIEREALSRLEREAIRRHDVEGLALRALVRPDEAHWRVLCALLTAWPDEGAVRAALRACERVLVDWPERIRRLIPGQLEAPWSSLARTLDLRDRGAALSAEAILEAERAAPALTGVDIAGRPEAPAFDPRGRVGLRVYTEPVEGCDLDRVEALRRRLLDVARARPRGERGPLLPWLRSLAGYAIHEPLERWPRESFRATTPEGERCAIIAIRSDALLQYVDEHLRLLGLVRHPNLENAHGVFVEAEAASVVVELAHGWSMADILARRGAPLRVADALVVGVAVARALAAFHDMRGSGGERLRPVHRGVSPLSITLTRGGAVKLRLVGHTGGVAMMRSARAGIGGVRFDQIPVACLPPEQIRGRSLDARSDLYALGATLWELLVGARPFEGRSEFEVLRAALRGRAPSMRERRPELPEALEALVMPLLDPEPDRRPDDAAAFADRLELFLLSQCPGPVEMTLEGLRASLSR